MSITVQSHQRMEAVELIRAGLEDESIRGKLLYGNVMVRSDFPRTRTRHVLSFVTLQSSRTS